MFGFPLPLYNSGASGVKLTNNADSGFPKPNIGETFYSIKSGNWGDSTVWQTASGRVGLLPSNDDTVYVRHLINTNVTTVTINNLYIASGATLKFDNVGVSRTYTINGNIQSAGTIDTFSSTGFGLVLVLNGQDNRIDNYIIDSNSVTTAIVYGSTLTQVVLPLTYRNLGINNGLKYASSDLTITNALYSNSSGILEMNYYNLTINGTLGTGASEFNGTLSKNNEGSILIIGSWRIAQTAIYQFNGNPTIECRGGISVNGVYSATDSNFYLGTGSLNFTTNNQSISGINAAYNLQFYNPITIGAGLTLSCVGLTIKLNNTINGANGTSKLLQGATSPVLNFATLASVSSMTTGTWDFTTNANTIQYNGNYSATLPSYFTTFSSLSILGTGTKTLGANTTINANLTIQGNNSAQGSGNFNNGAYNLIVNGTTLTTAYGTFYSSVGGSLTFNGALTFGSAFTDRSYIDFSGNPSVECKAGVTFNSGYGSTFTTGTSNTWTFSTNNQSLIVSGGGGASTAFFYNILISGAITLSTGGASGSGIVSVSNSINGNNASSKLLNGIGASAQGGLRFSTSTSATSIMPTGTYDFTTNANIVLFEGAYSITIPSSITAFSSLTIGGSGTKTLGVNTTVNGDLRISAGTLQLSTYNLTVNGTTTLVPGASGGYLFKNGAGNVIFVGTLITGNFAGQFDFRTGNPTVELRGGISIPNSNPSAVSMYTGSGQWSFTTNNQSLSFFSTGFPINIDAPLLIASGITLTVASTSYATFKSTVNGASGTSTLLMAASSIGNYQSATQPMTTGILDTSTNLNTWIYGLNNQNIKGGPSLVAKQVYRNLTLNGTGVKTLQGYVSVLNTYTLTSPATLALNGFTLTNP